MAVSESWRAEYPFASHHLDVDGVGLHYIDEGPGDQGRPLLMVHGNPTWSFYWRHLVQGLRDKHRCVAVDHIGCGLSDKPQDYEYTLRRHTDNLSQLIESLDLRDVTLLAHDWGGAIGLGALMAAPERFRHVILFNTGAWPPHFVPLRIRACRTPLAGRIALRGLNLFARAALTMAVERPLSSAARAGYLAPYDSWAHRVAVWRFVRDIPLTRRHPTWETLARLERQLPDWIQPVDLIWGMKDWCFDPSCLERFQAIWPQAQSHPLPQAGHYVVEDARDEILELLKDRLSR
ncbi:MAG: alpha/beta fold hydrolase [Planctomycetales bacterium]|nr:alpha/beta fold hydrolase [Planctomycetales bacterium]